jgi:tRNA(Ile)-lysidine synthase
MTPTTTNSSLLTTNSSLLVANCSLKKNLLAFSAGIDSSALFFLLIENSIPFDIAIVDYGVRDQSKAEVAHAKALAKRHNLTCYSTSAPYFEKHFEQQARAFRYGFFEGLIREHGYDTLLTAHQLNDQLEWLLMRLSRGAGLSELIGLEPISQRENYTLVRPLLEHSKEELLAYLDTHHHPYFVDESNQDEKYERNRLRKYFSDPLLSKHTKGIRQSLHYLRRDKETLERRFQTRYASQKLRIIELTDPQAKAKAADLALKELGYLLSADQRSEIEKEQSLVIGGVWAVEQQGTMLYIAPYLTTEMPKQFKEQCRITKIPAKIRPYLFIKNINPQTLPTTHY